MQIQINGQTETYDDGITLLELLHQRDNEPSKVVIEHNGNIIPGCAFDKTAIADGDRIEIIHFVGGG